MRQLTIANNIMIYCLPLHTTHRLQPLNVGIFGPLQHAWQTRCNRYYITSGGHEMPKKDFLCEYMVVRDATFTPDYPKKAWDKCGITTVTWTADFFDKVDYALSRSTSIEDPEGRWTTKEELQEIAFALGLTIAGKKAELIEAINACLDAHSEYANELKFAGLYLNRKQTLPPELQDENASPAPQQPRTEPSRFSGAVASLSSSTPPDIVSPTLAGTSSSTPHPLTSILNLTPVFSTHFQPPLSLLSMSPFTNRPASYTAANATYDMPSLISPP
ncbi:hypothetical protein NUW54_g1376 [Trametes sanguinea]|uniref:Uncharacterized protein n=1 Tax=Trametes sanguinea TaxID=158606 RepID=A0ACC1Q8X8_9APHY|nr:hypothetical protein NUW54_g1376 [Trametes sanguinea]